MYSAVVNSYRLQVTGFKALKLKNPTYVQHTGTGSPGTWNLEPETWNQKSREVLTGNQ